MTLISKSYRLLPICLRLFPALVAAGPPPAEWDGFDAAQERIESIRMRDFTVEVLNPDGQPLPGARVQVEMLRHHFQFGSAINMWAFTADGPNPQASRYLDVFQQLS